MPVAFSGTATSVAANSDSADLATGTYQFLRSRGVLTLYAKPSATGMKASLKIDGFPIIDRQSISNFGATGGLDIGPNSANMIDSVVVNGGRVELTFTNTTGGALTVDYAVKFMPTK